MNRLISRFAGALLAFAAAFGTPPPASAQPDTAVQWQATAQRTTVRPGDRVAVAVSAVHAPHFHTWPAAHVALPPEIDAFAIRTSIEGDFAAAAGWATPVGEIQWPSAKPDHVPNPEGEGTVKVPLYSGTATAFITLEIANDAAHGERTFVIDVAFQACDETMCYPPEEPRLEVKFIIADVAGPENDPRVFAAYLPPTGPSSPVPPKSSTSLSTAEPQAPLPTGSVVATGTRPNLFGLSLPDPRGFGGLIVLFLVAAIGGAVLNLTPCVLPVIPIKVMTLTQHAGHQRSRAIVLGAWMALGVTMFWVVAGLPMALFSAAADPSRLIFGNWWVALGLGHIIAVMGLGIMGLFTINLPQSVYMVNPKADTAWGSFVFGVFTAILGLPCFGFVAGGLLAGAATLPSVAIMTIFLGLGVGMAAPYLVLAAYPKLIEKVPRTGPASELVKQVMGLLLLAAAAFFIAAGLRALVSQKPYLSETLSWWAVAFFIVLAGVWLTLRIFTISRRTWPRIVFPALALLAVSTNILFASGMTRVARQDHERRDQVLKALNGERGTGYVTGAWLPYDAKVFERARADGKVVVVDFTADWCINCKFLKRTVLDSDAVRSQVTRSDVVLMEVDVTSKDAEGWKFLAELGQTGVPTLAVFGPGLDKPLIYNAYTRDTVISAIVQAGAETPRAGTAAPPAPPDRSAAIQTGR